MRLGKCALILYPTMPAQLYVSLDILDPATDAMIFKNIFAEKFSEKIGIFDSKQS
jgi:hypothetical protein